MTTSILFVCLGNICRSPTAEAVTQARLAHRDITLDSAGTGRWHIGEPPYGPMQDAAKQRGIPMDHLRARQVSRADFNRFDLIVAMDRDNLADLRAMQPKGTGAGAALCLMTDFLDEAAPQDVPDPYYTRDFDGTLTLIEKAAAALLAAYDAGKLTSR